MLKMQTLSYRQFFNMTSKIFVATTFFPPYFIIIILITRFQYYYFTIYFSFDMRMKVICICKLLSFYCKVLNLPSSYNILI